MKKQTFIRKSSVILLSCFLIVLCVSPVFASCKLPEIPTLFNQEQAVNADIVLQSAFQSEDASPVYPATYGGRYVDQELLKICVTDLSDEACSWYQHILCGFEDNYEFILVDYSLNELSAFLPSVIELYEKSGVNVIESAIDQSENAIYLGISEGSLSKAVAVKAKRSRIPYESHTSLPQIILECVGDCETETTTLYGGDTIYNERVGSFTNGVCGTFCGDPAILTCAHGGSTGQQLDDVIQYSNKYGAIIGDVTYKNYGGGVYGDYEIVTITNSNFVTSKLIKNQYSVSGTYASPAEGVQLTKYGRASGTFTTVEVTSTNVSITHPSTGYTIHGMTKCHITSGSSIGGDSGGPYFKNNGNSVLFCGIHSAHDTANDNLYFTPWDIISDSGFSVKTS